MATNFDNNSYDLIWETIRHNNAFLVKRKQAGGVQFSRDPLNLTNKHSRKYSSLANPRAIGIQAGENNSVVLTTKLGQNSHKPAKAFQTSTFNGSTSSRKISKNVVSSTAKKSYRGDLRAEAVARASAIKKSQRPVKETKRENKPRSQKAIKAAEAKA